MKNALLFSIFFTLIFDVFAWGFHAHKKINEIAIFTLPMEMLPFYKRHIEYIRENAVNPDRRRYAMKGEAPKHYIDIDVYGDSAVYTMPRSWGAAVEKYGEDTLLKHGIAPWNIQSMRIALTKAFREKKLYRILRLSADLGHYIADVNVPLHTTENYNGQLTGQHGIHGLWESRLPELFSENYYLFTGSAKYIDDTQERAWSAVVTAHEALDSVLTFEKNVSERVPPSKSFSYEEKGKTVSKVYSQRYSNMFHNQLSGQVEAQMKRSISMVGDFWFTCWVDAGQPNLDDMLDDKITEEERIALKKQLDLWKKGRLKTRSHEGKEF